MKKALSIMPVRQELNEIDQFLARQGFDNWTLKSRRGQRTLVGKLKSGETIRIADYSGNGFSERTVSMCAPLSASERKKEAKRLRGVGHTQAEIADRLGCSQKTISLDLSQ